MTLMVIRVIVIDNVTQRDDDGDLTDDDADDDDYDGADGGCGAGMTLMMTMTMIVTVVMMDVWDFYVCDGSRHGSIQTSPLAFTENGRAQPSLPRPC